MSTARVRPAVWFALGAVMALAATLLVTSTWRAGAAPGDIDSTFVPTAGCRLTDTRSGDDNIGPRSTPLGSDEILEIAVRGDNGQCTGPLAVPDDAIGVALNVTAVDATAASNLRFYPANLSAVPLLSNLNVRAGAPPTPNAVDVQLSPGGAIKAYNFQGQVNIILDVRGYYTTSSLKTLAQSLIPSGTTVRGTFTASGFGNSGGSFVYSRIDLPGQAPQQILSADVNFSSDGRAATTDDNLDCTGNPVEPTAPAGQVCLYLYDPPGPYPPNVNSVTGEGIAIRFDPPDPTARSSDAFVIRWRQTGTTYFAGGWAYTAP